MTFDSISPEACHGQPVYSFWVLNVSFRGEASGCGAGDGSGRGAGTGESNGSGSRSAIFTDRALKLFIRRLAK